MKSQSILLSLWILGLVTTPAMADEPPDGFRVLFDGKTLDGWTARPHYDPRKLAEMSDADRDQQLQAWMKDARKHWSVQNGELVNDGKGPYLTTKDSFRDFELRLQYKTVPLADSGIYLKATPQVQIWDFTDPEKFKHRAELGSGGLWNNSPGAAGKDPLVLADRALGEWNDFRIIQVGARTTVYLNDHLVVDHATMENFWDRQSPLFVDGPIQLQTHGGEIRWRNLHIRELDAAAANEVLAGHQAVAFKPLFNGKDFNGWQGAVDDYQVVDGAISCRAGKGGNLLTKDEYGNFTVRLEFRLPPGGNNGLAIRSPLSGDASVDAFCELQVLDNSAKKYAKLDPRQYHGSVYGVIPARRGYLREPGQWNFQQVTIDGTQVTVELNGTVILSGDVSQVDSFMDGKDHPGISRKRGHFGFAGHRDPVEFRNIAIRELAQ
ncbi:MAG: DUF1080 domain-containing protein [Planctomycetota bacterium]